MAFFLMFINLILLIILLFYLSDIEIDIKNYYYDSKTKTKDFLVYIKLKIFKITYFKLKFSSKKNKKYRILNLGNKFLRNKVFEIENIKKISKLENCIKKIDLNLNIGLIDLILTTFSVAFISAVLSLYLSKLVQKHYTKECKYKIMPIYNTDKIELKLRLNCIINVKMVHIINIIYTLLQKTRSDKNYVRTSYRRTYACCNEQHKRYGRC